MNFVPPPRMWNLGQVAARLGMAKSTFESKRKRLIDDEKFPQADSVLKKWDSALIEKWLDRRSGLLVNDEGNEWTDAIDAT